MQDTYDEHEHDGEHGAQHAIPLLPNGHHGWRAHALEPSRKVRQWRTVIVASLGIVILGSILAGIQWSGIGLRSETPLDMSTGSTCLVIHAERYAAGVQLPDAEPLDSGGLGDFLRRTAWSRLLSSNSGCSYAVRPFDSVHGYSPPALLNLTAVPALPAGRVCHAKTQLGAPCEAAQVEDGCSLTLVTDNSYRHPWSTLACPAAKQSLVENWLALYPLPPPPPPDTSAIVVAVHYRWGDLAEHQEDQRRLSPDEIRRVLATLRGANLDMRVTLHAEGLDPAQRPDLGQEYDLNNGDGLVETVNSMAMADVLVAASSGFVVLPVILASAASPNMLVVTSDGGANILRQFNDNVALLEEDEAIVQGAVAAQAGRSLAYYSEDN